MLFSHQVMCSTLNILKASLPIRFHSIGIRTLISDSRNLRSTKLLSISFSGMFVLSAEVICPSFNSQTFLKVRVDSFQNCFHRLPNAPKPLL